MLIVNHTQQMLQEGHLTMTDYNYPIVQFYKFDNVATLRGAEKNGKMLVEYAVVLRIEFIPEGISTGPVKDIYFKIFKKGDLWSCRSSFGVAHARLPDCAWR